jgi:uncharacterized protein (TIGR01244 family)
MSLNERPSSDAASPDPAARRRRAAKIAWACACAALAATVALHFAVTNHFSNTRARLGGAVLDARTPGGAIDAEKGFALAAGFHVKDQIAIEDIAKAKTLGYDAIIAMRPDGEAPDQAPSAAMASAARQADIGFSYVPVPHGEIPDSAVVAFRAASEGFENQGQTVLIYCRSGKRAARTWALAAAAYGHAPLSGIENAVKASGQDVADLAPRMRAMRADQAAWRAKLAAKRAEEDKSEREGAKGA